MDGDLYQDECESLCDEAMGLLGMIDEVKAKARFLLNQINERKNSFERVDGEFINYADSKVRGFQASLCKYDRRMEEIGRILKDKYGFDFAF